MEIRIENVSKSYGAVQSLQPTSLVLEHGRFTTLLGPSGSGKTTLLRLIAGLETPDSGSIHFAGTCVFSAEKRILVPAEKRRLGMVFQDFALWPHMTVFENVAFGLRASRYKGDVRERVAEAVRMVRLTGKEQRFPHELSGGEQQRVSFARAIAVKPQLILLDEPLSALDAILRDEMRFELKELVSSLGLTALYVTHDQIEAMTLSDRILVMSGGQILQSGRPEDIYAEPGHPFVARFIGKSNWFADGVRMIRPEKLKISPSPGCDQSIEAVVAASAYMGDRYEVFFQTEESGLWLSYLDAPLSIGERVRLHFAAADVKKPAAAAASGKEAAVAAMQL